MNKLKKIVAISLLFSPILTFADVASKSDGTLNGVIGTISNIVTAIIPILITAALAYFIYGVVKFISAGADGKKEAKDTIIYGIVGLFAIVSVWGLVQLLQSTFNITPTERITIPKI